MSRRHRKTLERIQKLEPEVFPELKVEPEPEYEWVVTARMTGGSKYTNDWTWTCSEKIEAEEFATSLIDGTRVDERGFIRLPDTQFIQEKQLISIRIDKRRKRW